MTALSKYLGIPKQFKELRQQYDLKWSTGNSDMLIIQRLLKADKNGKSELINSVRAVKQQLPSFSVFIDFITATGLRYVEALNSLNLIIQLDKEGKLHSYYQDYILQHFSHPTVFIRRTKRVFISIVPPDIIQEIAASESLTENVKKKKLQRRKLSLHFSDLREYWATLMTRYLSQPEIDFLQGRISSVFIARACLEGI